MITYTFIHFYRDFNSISILPLFNYKSSMTDSILFQSLRVFLIKFVISLCAVYFVYFTVKIL